MLNTCFALPTILNNNALSGSEDYQINEKTVNALFVQTVIANNTTLSPAQQGVLEAIAAQCPLSGGEAVLRARALLLGLGVVPVVYDDEKLCFVQERPGVEDRQARRETSTTAFWAYPNPASEQFNLAWYGSAEAGLSFILYDAVGRTVKNAHLPGAEGTVKISVSDLSNGVYYYTVKDKNGLLETKKILINR